MDEETERNDFVRNVVWGMLYYRFDAGIVSNSPEGLTMMLTVTVTVVEAADMAELETKTETMLSRTPYLIPGTIIHYYY